MGLIEKMTKSLNPYWKDFANNQKFEADLLKQLNKNSIGYGSAELDMDKVGLKVPNVGPGYGDLTHTSISFNHIFQSKKTKIAIYRDMAYYPEISEALDILCDESIVSDDDGDICHLRLTEEVNKSVEKIFNKEFKYVIDQVINVRDRLYDLYYKWLIEGELFLELILNDKKDAIIGVKTLPSFTCFPVYGRNGKIQGYFQSVIDDKGGEQKKPFEKNQIAYVNWGRYGENLLDVRGYLEPAVRSYNQLKNLEDSLVVYRLVRAPERRVWNIEVGRLPTNKAEAYIRKIIAKHKKQLNYNSSTGAIDASRNVQSLQEDFWFSKREGQGTEVSTIGGGTQGFLTELEDVNIFQSKMYKSLKIPRNRWDKNSSGSSTYQSDTNLDREELKFTLFVERTQNKFKKFIRDVFMEHMRFKYRKDKKISKLLENPYLVDIRMNQSNYFKQQKEMDQMAKKSDMFSSFQSYSEDNPSGVWSKEFAMLKSGFTEEEIKDNEIMLEKEKKEVEAAKAAQGDGEDGDDFGGGGNPFEKSNPPEGDQIEEEEPDELSGVDSLHKPQRAIDYLKTVRRNKKVL